MTRRSGKKKTSTGALVIQPPKKPKSLKQVAEALKESDVLFKTIVQTLPSILHLMDHRKKTYYISPNCEKIAGYPPEILNKIGNWIHPEDISKVQQTFDQAYRDKKAGRNFEYRAMRKNGEIWIASASWEPIMAEDGSFRGFVVQTEDVTAHKVAEQALQDSELRYRTLFEETGDAVVLTSEEGRLLAANRSARKLFGIKAKRDLSNSSILDFLYRPADHQPFLLEIQRRGFVRDYEILYRHSGGGLINGLVSAVLQKDQTGRPQYLGVIRDITKKKRVEEAIRESEKKYRSLIESTGTGFVILNEKGQVMDANPNYVRLTGHRHLKHILGRGVEEWTEESERTRNLAAVRECFRRGFIRGLEISYQDPRGQRIPVEVDATVVNGAEGPRIFSLVRDITPHKVTELALKTSRRQLRNLSEHLQTILEKEKKEISRRIHDDLGQQLTAIKMDLFWLNQRLSPDQPALSDKIKSMTRLIDGTIQTIQQISRELRPPLLEHLGLTATLEWQLKDFQNRTGIKGSLLISPKQLNLDQEDSTLIFRLIQEMLTNIIRHAEAQAVKITLKKMENRVKLTVVDNGRGITPDRIDDPRSLGLIGMRERVYARGGTIQFRGVPHGGTKINVEISLNRRGKRHDKNISRR
jgi:PAS domain S-box-containing protein